METTSRISKGRDGWEAKTIFPLPELARGDRGEYALTIHTYKGNRGLVSSASISQHGAGFTVHAFGSMRALMGDYSKTVLLTPTRCTEKAVQAQHLSALAQAEAVKAEGLAYYAAQAERIAREKAAA
jgi:hypothetical protein